MDHNFKKIISNVFNIKEEDVKPSLTKEDVGSWDSLKQMDLIFSLEESYNIQFEIEEIAKMNSIEEIVSVLLKKGINL
jgi:acyl carrier protein